MPDSPLNPSAGQVAGPDQHTTDKTMFGVPTGPLPPAKIDPVAIQHADTEAQGG